MCIYLTRYLHFYTFRLKANLLLDQPRRVITGCARASERLADASRMADQIFEVGEKYPVAQYIELNMSLLAQMNDHISAL
jgi:hypothetical protein